MIPGSLHSYCKVMSGLLGTFMLIGEGAILALRNRYVLPVPPP
jgi:hypothetical protein